MTRDNAGRLRHPAGAPKSIGGRYAPDTQRAGASVGGSADEQELQRIIQLRERELTKLGEQQHQLELQRTEIATELLSAKIETLGIQGPPPSQVIFEYSDQEIDRLEFDSLRDSDGNAILLSAEQHDAMDSIVHSLDFRDHLVNTSAADEYGEKQAMYLVEQSEKPLFAEVESEPSAEDYDIPAPVRAVTRARRALKDYGAVSGDTERNQTAVQDALTDLLHFADQEGVDIHHAHLQAVAMRDAEVTDPEM